MVFSGGEAWEVVRRLPAQVEAVAERLRRKAAFFGADDVDTEVATGVADGAILEIATRSDRGPDRDGNCTSLMDRSRAVRFDAAPRPAASDGAGSRCSRGRWCSHMAERASC